MKQIIIVVIICFTTACKGQTPVYTLGADNPNIIPSNCYFKDNNNILNKFVGTWVLTKNGNVFTIILNKAVMAPISDYYSDEIQGKYKYIVNGNTLVNTENFTGNNSKLKTTFMNFGTEKIALFFYDPERPKIGAKVYLTYTNVGGVEKLHWELVVTGYLPILLGEPAPQLDFRVPKNCELIKQ